MAAKNHPLSARDPRTEGRWREKDGKKMVRLQVRAHGQWRTPIYHPTDFFRKMESMSLPRSLEKVGFHTGFPVISSNKTLPIKRFWPLWKTKISYSRFKFLAEVRRFGYLTKFYFKAFKKLFFRNLGIVFRNCNSLRIILFRIENFTLISIQYFYKNIEKQR